VSIQRIHRKKRDFLQVDNAVVRDKRLSYKARGILLFALSHSDGYEATETWLIAASGSDGREAVRSGIKELEALGYRQKRKFQKPNGQWVTEIDWFEEPRT
jgi:hypothetical protein